MLVEHGRELRTGPGCLGYAERGGRRRKRSGGGLSGNGWLHRCRGETGVLRGRGGPERSLLELAGRSTSGGSHLSGLLGGVVSLDLGARPAPAGRLRLLGLSLLHRGRIHRKPLCRLERARGGV